MTDLVTIQDKQGFTTSLAIAKGTKNQHKAVLQLIKRHQKRFDKHKRVTFEV